MGSEPTTTRIDLIRHGEPEGGPMFRGSKDDPLSRQGWQQMEQAMADGPAWDVVLSSPLKRCQQFAATVAARQRLPLQIDERLREIAFGEWEGLTAAAIETKYPGQLSRFWADAEANPPPQGELLSTFQSRVLAAWDHWTERLAGQNVLLVCHGGVIRVILGQVLGIPRERTLSALDVPYAGCSRVRLDRNDHGSFHCLMSHGARIPGSIAGPVSATATRG